MSAKRPPLNFGRRTLVMGVINVTPDSFSDGGDFASAPAAADQARTLQSQGADILDLGAESTRPGSTGISANEELRRLLPVVEALGEGFGTPLSVDTSKSLVARACLERGFAFVNDVTGGRNDPKMLPLVAEFDAHVVLMHMQGTPRSMQEAPTYTDVVEEVAAFLAGRVEAATAAGVRRERVLVDPGIGFGKTLEHNLQLLRGVPRLRSSVGQPIVVGASRKSMFGGLLGLDSPKARDRATADLSAVLAFLGADVLRVHEVPHNLEAARVGDAVRRGLSPPTTMG